MKQFASKHVASAALAGIGIGLAALPAAGADTTCNFVLLRNDLGETHKMKISSRP